MWLLPHEKELQSEQRALNSVDCFKHLFPNIY